MVYEPPNNKLFTSGFSENHIFLNFLKTLDFYSHLLSINVKCENSLRDSAEISP